MGLKKFVKRVGKKAKGFIKKAGGTVLKPIKGVFDRDDGGGGDDASADLEARSAAARQQRTVNRQAGSGQITYETEE